MQTATIISQNGHQSVHLPEGIRIPAEEVYVKRVGRSLLLIPKDADSWDVMAESLEHFTSDFMQERSQPAQQEREGLG
jgi:antitoxin VapB